ncbi:MAG: ABC transporter permease subunit [Lachnospiraceae bacterium]|nr:ABC transporter permease subunit [Lachnospiraceae bacterium]
MRNLWKAELFKISRSLNYKVLMFISIILGISNGRLMIQNMPAITGIDMFSIIGTDILINVTLICIFAADFIGSEFTNRTFANDILQGVSRKELFWSKSAVFFAGTLLLLYTRDLISVCMVTIYKGFGMEWGKELLGYLINSTTYCILCNTAMGSYILFVAFLIKNKIEIFAFGMGSIYVLMLVEENTQNTIFLNILRVTFVYQLNDLRYGNHTIHNPFWFIVVSSLVMMGGWIFLAIQVFKKSELK